MRLAYVLSVSRDRTRGRINIPAELMRLLRLDQCERVAAEVIDLDIHERMLTIRLVCRDQEQEP